MGRISLKKSLHGINITKALIRIIIAFLIAGFLVAMVFTFMSFSETYTLRYKEEFVQRLNNEFNNIYDSRVCTNPVEDGKVSGIVLEKLFSGEQIAFGKGLFIYDNTFKKVIDSEDGKVLVEVPLRMITPIFSVSKDVLWYLADSNGNVLNTSIQGSASEEPRTLDFTENRLVYYYKYSLTGDLTLGVGYIFPPEFFLIVFTGTLALFLSFWYAESFLDKASSTLEEILKGIGVVKRQRESFSSNIEEIDSLNKFVDELRYAKTKNEDDIHSLKKNIEKLKLEISTLKEKNYLKVKNLMREFSSSIYKRIFDCEIDIGYFTELAILTAQELGIASKEELESIELGLLAVDLGIIYVRNSEYKERDINDETYLKHPIYGEEMFKRIGDFELVCDIVRQHHERYDGKGFPDGLKGEKLSLRSKIVSLISSYMAYVLPEPCGEGKSMEKALEKIRKEKGKKFDPVVVESFEKVLVTAK
ncbi:MAG: HD domain-containing phosphohydrolase [Thermotogota bacterium]|nr:HD domain-containing phosphohydrolase [Thermotogota bacterium]